MTSRSTAWNAALENLVSVALEGLQGKEREETAMTEWQASMPKRYALFEWGIEPDAEGGLTLARNSRSIVERANEELAKARAERDEALRAFSRSTAQRITESARLIGERDAALARVRDLTEMRPLVEAPRDGSPILVWLRLEDDPVVMRWCPRGQWWNACRDSEGEVETFRDDALLGWLPLPKPLKAF